MVIDFNEAKSRLHSTAKAKKSAELLTVTYDANGKLSVTLNRDAARRFDSVFGEAESQGLLAAVSTELQETLRACGSRLDVLRKVV